MLCPGDDHITDSMKDAPGANPQTAFRVKHEMKPSARQLMSKSGEKSGPVYPCTFDLGLQYPLGTVGPPTGALAALPTTIRWTLHHFLSV